MQEKRRHPATTRQSVENLSAFRIVAVLLLATIFLPVWAGAAEDTSALINQRLDKLFVLKTSGDLPTVLKKIADETGVPVEADRRVYALLPWGEQTSVTADLQNTTLRAGLTAITQKLGLVWVLGDQTIDLEPCPALRRLARRATIEELGLLDILAHTPLEPTIMRSPTVPDLLGIIDSELQSLKTPYAVEDRAVNQRQVSASVVSVQRTATMMQALDAMSDQTGSTWCPWGRTLLVLSQEDQIRYQLSKPISARFNGVEIAQVLSELAARSGVFFQIEPGALQRIPKDYRTIKLVIESASVQQTLETIAGSTGLAYAISEQGVRITYAGVTTAPATQP